MTREVAILHMILRREELKHSVGDLDEDIKAFDMAIQALEQQPCEDAISRQAAIDAMATWDWQELYLPIHFKQLLEELPSVSTEKTGRWIYDRRRDWDGECKYECSECGMGSDVDFPYCMRCGTKMEVEE